MQAYGDAEQDQALLTQELTGLQPAQVPVIWAPLLQTHCPAQDPHALLLQVAVPAHPVSIVHACVVLLAHTQGPDTAQEPQTPLLLHVWVPGQL